MKRIVLFISLIAFGISNAKSQDLTVKNSPVGKWKFETPYASEGYQVGLIHVSYPDNKYNIAVSFADTINKLTANNVRLEAETLGFSLFIEGQQIDLSFQFAGPDSLVGSAATPEGAIPMTLIRKK